MKKTRMNKYIKKLIQVSLVFFLTITTLALIPQTRTEAAIGGEKRLMFGETGLNYISNPTSIGGGSSWQGDWLYWGSGSMSWQILSKNSSEFNSNPGLLILSGGIGTSVYYHNGDYTTYSGSSLDVYLNNLSSSRLSGDEYKATLNSSGPGTFSYVMEYGLIGTDSPFTNRKWFAPTGSVVLNSQYGFSNSTRTKDLARRTSVGNDDYWIASTLPDDGVLRSSNVIRVAGEVGARINESPLIVRATSKIDKNSILFVSTANGGKTGGAGGVMESVGTNTTNQWKLTLKDSAQSVSNIKSSRIAKDKVEVTLDKAGKGTSISAIITDAAGTNILYYSRIASVKNGATTGAKATLTLPDEVIKDSSKYKLKVFTESYSGETATDYASDPVDVTILPFEVTGTYQYRNVDGTMAPEVKTVYNGGLNFDDLAKPMLVSPIEGYRLKEASDATKHWVITPTTVDKTKITEDFTATADYIQTFKVKLDTGLDGMTPYFDGIVDSGRNLQEDGVVGSSADGFNKVEVVSPIPPTGYRFDGWEYTDKDGNPISGADAGKANVENVQMSFHAKAKYVKVFDVEFSDGQGTEESNRVEVELDDGTNVSKQVIDIGNNAIVPKEKTSKPYYHFSQWNSAFNIQTDRRLSDGNPITPIYSPYKYTINSLYGLYSYTKEESKTNFSALSNAEIDAKLAELYAPDIYRDNILQNFGEEKSPNDGTYKDKVKVANVDYDALRNGNKGKYTFTLHYENSTALGLDPDEKDFKADRQVEIKIADSVNAEAKARIAANDFTISIKEVESIWFNNVVQLASAQSFGEDGALGVVRVDFDSLSKLPKKAGVYPLIFTSKVQMNGVITELRTTVNVTIKDESKVDDDSIEQINGNNFTIPLDQAESIISDDARLIDLGGIVGVNIEQGRSIPVMVSDKSNLKAEKGNYVVTFKTTTPNKNTVFSVTVSVVDKEVIKDNEKISGNNFSMKSSEVKELLALKDSEIVKQLIAFGKVKAIDINKLNELVVQVDYSALKEKSGVYDIVYTTVQGTILTLQATVSDGSVENGDERISANDFTMLTSEVKEDNLTNAKLIEYGNAIAKNIKTNKDIAITNVTHTILKKPGDYTVTYSTGQPTSITVNVHVRDTIEEKDKESISANHFMIKTSDVSILDDNKLMILANVKAMNTDKKIPIPVTVKENKIETLAGQYDLTFTTGKTDITVKVTVRDEIIINDKTREGISANHFDVFLDQVEELDNDRIIALAKAKAYNMDTGEDVAITSVEHKIRGSLGEYTVTFKTDAKTSISVIATVRDQSIEENGEKISGSGFVIRTEDVKDLKDSDFIRLGRVKAFTLLTGQEVPVTVDYSEFKPSRGVYDIFYHTEKGTSLKLEAEVRDEITENTEIGERIVGNTIYLGIEEVYVLTDDVLKELSNVKAVDLDTRKEVDITKVEHNIKAENGEYGVDFSTDKGTTLRIKVFVEGNIIEDITNNERITGTSFKVKTEDAARLTEKDFIEKANVKAVDLDTGQLIDVKANYKNFSANVGSYDVIYSTKKGTTLTLKITVYAAEIKEKITGSDIYLSIEEASNVSNQMLQEKSQVIATDINRDTEVPITKYTNKIEPEKGIYEATFGTDLGTVLVVNVYVNNANIVQSTLEEQITGNKITVNPSDVMALNEAMILTLGNVKAIDLETAEFVNVYVDKSSLKDTVGTYIIPLSTSKGTTSSIEVEVKKDAPAFIIPDEPTTIFNKTKVAGNVFPIIQYIPKAQGVEEVEKESSKNSIVNNNTTDKNRSTDSSNNVEVQEKIGQIMWSTIGLYGVYMSARIFIRKKAD